MDMFEFNKIAGAVLGTVLILMVVNTLAHAVFESHEPAQTAYVVEGIEDAGGAMAGAGEAADEEEGPSLAMLLQEATAADGEKVARKCATCHTFDQGGANKIGPNLYNVVGREIASVSGFNYSDALASHGGSWTYEALANYLADPKGYIPGNKMAFAGLRRPGEQADMIAYLRANTANPPPLPQPEEAAAGEEAASAAQEATGAVVGGEEAPDEGMAE